MNRLDFLIDWYYKENDRQISLNESLSIPVGILTVMFGSLFYMFTCFSFSVETNLIIKSLFGAFMVIAFIGGLFVIFYLFKSYINFFEYKAPSYPSALNQYYTELEEYINQNKETIDENTTVDSLYEKKMIDMFSDCLDRNIENNDKKTSSLHKAKIFLLICIISVIFGTIPFTIHFFVYKETEHMQKVEIHTLSRHTQSNR